MSNREQLSRETMRSGEHALWDAHLIRGAARRDMTIAVEIMVKVGRDFEQSMMKFADAVKAMSQMGSTMAEMARKLGDDTKS